MINCPHFAGNAITRKELYGSGAPRRKVRKQAPRTVKVRKLRSKVPQEIGPNYLVEERGMSERALREFRVTWDPRKRAFVLPLYDARFFHQGSKKRPQPKGFKFYRPGQNPKMKAAAGTPSSKILYGQLPMETGRRVWLCEGEPDTLALISAGEYAVTPCDGAKPTLRGDFVDVLAPYRVVAAGDADPPGQRYTQAAVKTLGEGTTRVSWPKDVPKGWDVSDQLRKGGLASLEALVMEPESLRAPETIDVSEDEELHEIVSAAERALAARSDLGVYSRGNCLVRVVRDDARRLEWLSRSAGAPSIVVASEAWLREQLDRIAVWRKGSRLVRPSKDITSTLAKRREWPQLRPLEGVVESPSFLPTGQVLSSPGYHAETGLLYMSETDFPTIPQRPTKQQVARAAKTLIDPLCDFPFLSEADRSVVVMTILSLLARPAYQGPAPAVTFRAPVPGSGKSLLAHVVSIVATGECAPAMSQPGNDEESRKRITALALEGTPIVLIDNVAGSFGSESLAAALTAETWKDRILGSTESVTVPLRAIWLITGNNLSFRGDLGRRVIVCDIDPEVEFPEDRQDFRFPNLLEHVRRERPRLVAAALTILRGFHEAGRPTHGKERKGSFEAWDDLVRAATIWARFADPLETTSRVRDEGDEERKALAEC